MKIHSAQFTERIEWPGSRVRTAITMDSPRDAKEFNLEFDPRTGYLCVTYSDGPTTKPVVRFIGPTMIRFVEPPPGWVRPVKKTPGLDGVAE